jgi:hypothetical protein
MAECGWFGRRGNGRLSFSDADLARLLVGLAVLLCRRSLWRGPFLAPPPTRGDRGDCRRSSSRSFVLGGCLPDGRDQALSGSRSVVGRAQRRLSAGRPVSHVRRGYPDAQARAARRGADRRFDRDVRTRSSLHGGRRAGPRLRRRPLRRDGREPNRSHAHLRLGDRGHQHPCDFSDHARPRPARNTLLPHRALGCGHRGHRRVHPARRHGRAGRDEGKHCVRPTDRSPLARRCLGRRVPRGRRIRIPRRLPALRGGDLPTIRERGRQADRQQGGPAAGVDARSPQRHSHSDSSRCTAHSSQGSQSRPHTEISPSPMATPSLLCRSGSSSPSTSP